MKTVATTKANHLMKYMVVRFDKIAVNNYYCSHPGCTANYHNKRFNHFTNQDIQIINVVNNRLYRTLESANKNHKIHITRVATVILDQPFFTIILLKTKFHPLGRWFGV